MNIGRIVRRISRACPPLTYLFIPVVKAADRLQGGPLHGALTASIERYCSDGQKKNAAYLRRTRRDLWYSFIRYDCPFDEYFMFRFSQLSPAGRHAFVTDYENIRLVERITSPEVRAIFWNKWNTYQAFQPFYHRDAMLIDSSTTVDELAAFTQKHPRFMVKPCESSYGRGIRLVDMHDASAPSLPELLTQLQSERAMVEEVIVQCEEMAAFHPASVNTIRCATFQKDGQAVVLFAFMRTGQGSSVVDNGGAGGLVAAVDIDTGIVYSPGTTEGLMSALVHPDTGKQILGFRVPRWEELKELVLRLALVVPQLQYGSWDLALTDDGWVMVEGNHGGQFLTQYTARQGLRARLSQYFDL